MYNKDLLCRDTELPQHLQYSGIHRNPIMTDSFVLIVDTDYNGKDDSSVVSSYGVFYYYDIRPE